MQDLLRQLGVPQKQFPTIHVVTYGLPRHNLARRPQPPSELTTILRVLQLPDGPAGNAVFNHLVDDKHVESRVLVEVRLCQLILLQASTLMEGAPARVSLCRASSRL